MHDHTEPLGILALIDSPLPAGPFDRPQWSVHAPGSAMPRYTAHRHDFEDRDPHGNGALVEPTRKKLEFASALVMCQVCFDDDVRDRWRIALHTWGVAYDVTEHLTDLVANLGDLGGDSTGQLDFATVLEDLRCVGLYLSDTPVDEARPAGDIDLPWVPGHIAAREAAATLSGDPDVALVMADAVARLEVARKTWDVIVESGIVGTLIDANPLGTVTSAQPDPVWAVLFRDRWEDAADELAEPAEKLTTVFTLATTPIATTDRAAVFETDRRTLSILGLGANGDNLAPRRADVNADQVATAAALFEADTDVPFRDVLEALLASAT